MHLLLDINRLLFATRCATTLVQRVSIEALQEGILGPSELFQTLLLVFVYV